MLDREKIKKYIKNEEYGLAYQEMMLEIKLKYVAVMKKRGILITTQTPMYEISRIVNMKLQELKLVTVQIVNLMNAEIDDEERLNELFENYVSIIMELEKYE